MQRPRSEGLSAENPLGQARPPFAFGGGRGRGRSRGLSFVSRGEALRRGLTVGSRTGVGVAMTSPARPQMPPAGRAPVDKRPQDSIAAAEGGGHRGGEGGPPPARGQRQERVARGGTMGPDRDAPGAAPARGGQDHRPGAGQPHRKGKETNPVRLA